MTSYRSARIADAIKRELIFILQGSLEDPRLEGIVVEEVELSKDSSHARIFFSVDDPNLGPQTEKILGGAVGYIRTLLAQALNLGYTPALRFVYDKSAVRRQRLNMIFERIETNQHHNNDSND
jgi:ribosome-binding factor A